MTPAQAAEKFPSFCTIGQDGTLELYLDNVMLSAFRKCQGYFWEQFLSQQNGKRLLPQGRSWGLEFGGFLHKALEYFYQAQREDWEGIFVVDKGNPAHWDGLLPWRRRQDAATWLQICNNLWMEHNLDFFLAKEYEKNIGKTAQALGGWEGMQQLCIQYYKRYWRQERFRYVGAELTFGRGKEVPIVTTELFRGYLCGRLDLIVDDSSTIGPLDFKSASYFDGQEAEQYKPHDGLQGYTYFVNNILSEELKAQGRVCDTIIVRHISVRPDKEQRFKDSYISFTPGQMDAWLQRQQRTYEMIYDVVVLEKPVVWNTDDCDSGFYHRPCPFKIIHNSPAGAREGIIRTYYQISEAWDYSRSSNGN